MLSNQFSARSIPVKRSDAASKLDGEKKEKAVEPSAASVSAAVRPAATASLPAPAVTAPAAAASSSSEDKKSLSEAEKKQKDLEAMRRNVELVLESKQTGVAMDILAQPTYMPEAGHDFFSPPKCLEFECDLVNGKFKDAKAETMLGRSADALFLKRLVKWQKKKSAKDCVCLPPFKPKPPLRPLPYLAKVSALIAPREDSYEAFRAQIAESKQTGRILVPILHCAEDRKIDTKILVLTITSEAGVDLELDTTSAVSLLKQATPWLENDANGLAILNGAPVNLSYKKLRVAAIEVEKSGEVPDYGKFTQTTYGGLCIDKTPYHVLLVRHLAVKDGAETTATLAVDDVSEYWHIETDPEKKSIKAISTLEEDRELFEAPAMELENAYLFVTKITSADDKPKTEKEMEATDAVPASPSIQTNHAGAKRKPDADNKSGDAGDKKQKADGGEAKQLPKQAKGASDEVVDEFSPPESKPDDGKAESKSAPKPVNDKEEKKEVSLVPPPSPAVPAPAPAPAMAPAVAPAVVSAVQSKEIESMIAKARAVLNGLAEDEAKARGLATAAREKKITEADALLRKGGGMFAGPMEKLLEAPHAAILEAMDLAKTEAVQSISAVLEAMNLAKTGAAAAMEAAFKKFIKEQMRPVMCNTSVELQKIAILQYENHHKEAAQLEFCMHLLEAERATTKKLRAQVEELCKALSGAVRTETAAARAEPSAPAPAPAASAPAASAPAPAAAVAAVPASGTVPKRKRIVQT